MTVIQFDELRKKKTISEKMPFEQVFEQYYSKVLLYLIKKTGNQQEAEDLCSEAFLYCFDHYDSYYPGKSAVSTWLYLVVNSRLKNYYRDRKVHVDLADLQNVLPNESNDMDRGVYLEQMRTELAKAIETLPERQQKIVVMSYFEQKSSAEIAAELGMTPGNVRVQLTRALDKLEVLCKNLKV